MPEALEEALEAKPDAVAVFAVSPTYFGAVADIAGLAEVAHARDVPLVVDESWGAHLAFSDELPANALACGADVVLNSVHKLGGSMTQSAILHLGADEANPEGRIDGRIVDRSVTLVESTSPSAILTASLDAARRHNAVAGEALLAETIASLNELRREVREIPGLDVLGREITEAASVFAWDPLRLSIDVRGTGATGNRIAVFMRERHDIWFELYAENVVVAVFGIGENVATTGARAARRPPRRRRAAAHRGGRAEVTVRAAAAVGADGDDSARGVPRPAGDGSVRRRRGPDRLRVAGCLPTRRPQRPARRAAQPRHPRLHRRLAGPRRPGARRKRPDPLDDQGGDRMNDANASEVPWGADSEYGRLLDVLLCPPDNFRWLPTSAISKATLEGDRSFSSPAATAQHAEMVSAYESAGVRCHFLEPDPALPYQVFARDSSVATPEGAIVTQLHQQWRRGEYAPVIRFYREAGIPIHRMITAAALEGGDVVIVEPGKMVIGNGEERTEVQAARQLAAWMEELGWEVRIEMIPSQFIHIDVLLAILAPKLAAVCVDVAGAGLIRWLRDAGFEIVDVPVAEAFALGVNAISLGDGRALSSEYSKSLNEQLRARGIEVYDPDLSMFTLGGGGAHCLAQALRRERVA